MSEGLSASVRSSLLALQKLTTDISRVQQRLATGKRVNSASENPAAFFTASALNTRAAALNAVVDGIGTGKMVLEAASTGIDSMQAMIASARSLAYEALNSASTLAEVEGSVTGLTGATSLSALGFDGGDTITVSDGTTTATYTHAGGQDIQDFLDAVNNQAGLNVEASLTADGRIHLEATGVNNVTVGGSASVGELSAIGLSAGTTSSTTNAVRQSLAQQVDSIRGQIDAVALDAGFNGKNLLVGGTLTIRLNETGSANVTVAGSLVNASSLGIGAVSGAGGSFQYDGDINAFIADLDAASTSLQQTASSYSSTLATVSVREDFTRAMSDLMTSGADNLVNADMDYEGAMLLALQSRRELAGTSLSLAVKSHETALRLFRIG